MKHISWVAVMATAILPNVAAAEEGLYFGLGAGYSSAISSTGPVAGFLTPLDSEDKFGLITGVVGYRWDMSSSFFGVEADLDLSLGSEFTDDITGRVCETAANGPYYCSHDATVRLRGIYGTQVSDGLELYGAMGVGLMKGDGAINENIQDGGSSAGLTLGVGLQHELKSGHKIRGEITYDNFTQTYDNPSTPAGTEYNPEYEAISLRVTYLFGG